MKKDFLILSVDTSCDDTSVAVLENDKVLANAISSQIELHRKYGGTVPIIAARAHTERLVPMIYEALKRAGRTINQVDVFAVTYGPGLAIALDAGIKKIKELCIEYNKPLVAVNHLEGHIYANFAKNSNGVLYSPELQFPILVALVSGGHTELVLMKNHGDFKLIGETLDDACGEAFDKVARLLKLGYPGGPIIEKMAKDGDIHGFNLPTPMKNSGDYNMSYSGLKTAVLHLVKELEGKTSLHQSLNTTVDLNKQQLHDLSASFQEAAFGQITFKLEKAIKEFKPKSILIGGGVSANLNLRKKVREICKKYDLLFSAPGRNLAVDNAAMIGVAAYYHAINGDFVEDIQGLQRNPILNFK